MAEFEVIRDKAPIKELKIGDNLFVIYPDKDDGFQFQTFYVGHEPFTADQLESIGKLMIELANQGRCKEK